MVQRIQQVITWPSLKFGPINLYNIPRKEYNMATVGELADTLWLIREEKRNLAIIEKEINARQSVAEKELMAAMLELGIEGGKATYASFIIKKSFVPKVEDWDAFYKYVQQTGYFHLLHKRLSVAGCEEIFTREHRLPGVIAESITTVNLLTRRDLNDD